MNDPDGVLLPHGGYESLRSYKVAEAVYDATVVFCDRFIEKGSLTHDQMVQAARSGVRNISEGSGAAATSPEVPRPSARGDHAARSDRCAAPRHQARGTERAGLPACHSEMQRPRAP